MTEDFQIILIKNDGTAHDITDIAGALTWRDSLDSLGVEMSLEVARNNEDTLMRRLDLVELADRLILNKSEEEIFMGIIVDLDIKKRTKSMTALDFAFYLNNSQALIQFNGVRADSAIKQLCRRYNVPVGEVETMTTPISKIYSQESISDIMKDILDQVQSKTGSRKRLEMRGGKLYITSKEEVISPTFRPAGNIASAPSLNAIGSVNKTLTISSMKNVVSVISGSEGSERVVSTKLDSSSINKYGRLEHLETVQDEDVAQSKNIAKNKLNELNKVGEDLSITTLGDTRVRSGTLIELNQVNYDIGGRYRVKESEHKVSKNIHTMTLNLEKVVK